MMREQAIQSKIIRGLERKGFYVQKIVGQSRPGLPDIFAVNKTMMCFVEVKTVAGRLRDSQVREITGLVSIGCAVFVVAGEDSIQDFVGSCLNCPPQNIWDVGDLEHLPHGGGWWLIAKKPNTKEGM